MNNILFADSGGTSTDWIFNNADGNIIEFQTESYHPSNWGIDFWERIEQYWKSNQHLLEYSLHFFGAGCLNEENAALLNHKFQSFGFKNVQVKSDLHAAGYACYKNQDGTIIISGTGSVLFHYSYGEVKDIVGGKGHELGDEGSGFYFGKLIIEKFKNRSLSDLQLTELNKKVDLSTLSQLDPSRAKFHWAELSKYLQNDVSLFNDIHKANIKAFIETHFTNGIPETAYLVGSYAYHNKELWKAELSSIGCKVEMVIQKPIKHFIE